jgi:hypothetical protein
VLAAAVRFLLSAFRRRLVAAICTIALFSLPAAAAQDASPSSSRWMVEQMPGGDVKQQAGSLEISDVAGCTVWWREKLTAPFTVSYDVTMIAAGGANDRVSDLNCFWLATDPKSPDGCPFAAGFGRTGKFEAYDSLRTYYVGMGGNDNTTTRFRRYAGDGTKPLLPEHDLRDQKFLLEPNKTYHIEVNAGPDGLVEFRRDGDVIFSWRDPAPLPAGWFGIRTVKSHQVIRNFRIHRPD